MASVPTFTGANAMLAKINRLKGVSPDVFGNAMVKEGNVEVKECQRQCPVESGDMKDEIHVAGPFREGRTITIMITTGPKSEEYALRQHEDPDLVHRVGNWKFIEGPLMESAPHMAARIASRIDLKDGK